LKDQLLAVTREIPFSTSLTFEAQLPDIGEELSLLFVHFGWYLHTAETEPKREKK
jgi:hypothetical protein